MKLLEYYDILNPELFGTSQNLRTAWDEIQRAIALTDWPHGTGRFIIYPECGKKAGEGNGVKPIKIPCLISSESTIKRNPYPPFWYLSKSTTPMKGRFL